jgi:hypothetical protein
VNGTHNRDQKELVLDKSEPTRITETREKQQEEFAHITEYEYRLIPSAILRTGENRSCLVLRFHVLQIKHNLSSAPIAAHPALPHHITPSIRFQGRELAAFESSADLILVIYRVQIRKGWQACHYKIESCPEGEDVCFLVAVVSIASWH